MSGKRVIELRDVAIYHAENPFGRQSAERLVRSGELVLSEVDFSVEEGEFVYLIGRVGSGKSTLLKTLYADVQLLVGEGCVVVSICGNCAAGRYPICAGRSASSSRTISC